jgi:hypothetical protein
MSAKIAETSNDDKNLNEIVTANPKRMDQRIENEISISPLWKEENRSLGLGLGQASVVVSVADWSSERGGHGGTRWRRIWWLA